MFSNLNSSETLTKQNQLMQVPNLLILFFVFNVFLFSPATVNKQ